MTESNEGLVSNGMRQKLCEQIAFIDKLFHDKKKRRKPKKNEKKNSFKRRKKS